MIFEYTIYNIKIVTMDILNEGIFTYLLSFLDYLDIYNFHKILILSNKHSQLLLLSLFEKCLKYITINNIDIIFKISNNNCNLNKIYYKILWVNTFKLKAFRLNISCCNDDVILGSDVIFDEFQIEKLRFIPTVLFQIPYQTIYISFDSRIKIIHNEIIFEFIKALSNITFCNTLSELILDEIDELQSYNIFKNMPILQKLIKISLESFELEDDTIVHHLVEKTPNLEYVDIVIDINSCDLLAFDKILEKMDRTKLKRLNLPCNYHIKDLNKISDYNKLLYLDISGALISFRESLKILPQTLEYLNISHINEITADGHIYNQNGYDQNGYKYDILSSFNINELINLKQLKADGIDNCFIDIVHLQNLTKLTLLSINYNLIKNISYLVFLSSLECLGIDKIINIDICESIDLPTGIKTLYMSSNDMNQFNLQKNTKLKKLVCSNCSGDDLILLKLSQNLEYLDFCYNNWVTLNSLKILTDRMDNLKYLYLYSCNNIINFESVEFIQKMKDKGIYVFV